MNILQITILPDSIQEFIVPLLSGLSQPKLLAVRRGLEKYAAEKAGNDSAVIPVASGMCCNSSGRLIAVLTPSQALSQRISSVLLGGLTEQEIACIDHAALQHLLWLRKGITADVNPQGSMLQRPMGLEMCESSIVAGLQNWIEKAERNDLLFFRRELINAQMSFETDAIDAFLRTRGSNLSAKDGRLTLGVRVCLQRVLPMLLSAIAGIHYRDLDRRALDRIEQLDSSALCASAIE